MQWKLELQRHVADTSLSGNLAPEKFAADRVESCPGKAHQTFFVRTEIHDVDSAMPIVIDARDDVAGTERASERLRRFQNLIE